MIKTLFDLLCIAIIIVTITDISDWVETVKKTISYILTKGKIVNTQFRLHLLDCSFCQFFWCGLIYLLVTSNFTLMYVAIVCMLAQFTVVIKDAILLVGDVMIKIIRLVYKLIE